MNKKLFVIRLRKLMSDSRLSNKQLAIEIGVSQSQLSHMIHNERIPYIDILIKMADRFNVSIDWLVGRDDFLEEHRINTINQFGEILNRYEFYKEDKYE